MPLHRCSPNTVRNIIKKGMTSLYNGKALRFKALTVRKMYQENRSHRCCHYDALDKRTFLQYVEKHFKADGWPLDACPERALLAEMNEPLSIQQNVHRMDEADDQDTGA